MLLEKGGGEGGPHYRGGPAGGLSRVASSSNCPFMGPGLGPPRSPFEGTTAGLAPAGMLRQASG